MQKVLLIALLCLAIASAQKMPRGKEWWMNSKAQVLKSANFLEHVGKDKIVIIQFIARFSTECQTLFPQWEALADMYSGATPKRDDVTVALIDGWTYNSISQSYGVTSFPTILIFGKGDAQAHVKYEGEKTAEKFSEWVEQFANGEIDAAQPAEATDNAAAATPSEPVADNTAQNQDQQQQQQEPPVQQTPPAQEPPAQQAPPQEPPVQQQPRQEPPVQQTPPPQAQPEQPREVSVVLNTTLLQAQFEELQRHTTALNEALQKSIDENFQKFEAFKSLLDTHKQDLTTVGNNVRSHLQKFDEVKQAVVNQKDEIHKSVTGHTEKQVEELKNTINQIKARVFERVVEEPKESGFGSGTVMFVVGGLIGAAVTFVIVSAQGNKNRRKLLID